MAYTENMTPEAIERMKYCAYRHCWPRRNKLTPSGERGRGRNCLTWGQWFERMYGEAIEVYHATLRVKAEAEQEEARERSIQARREAQFKLMESLRE